MKVFVQIPCLNEEKTLLGVLRDIPKKIKGVDMIAVVIIDDGSTDQTIAVAKKLGVKHFVRHSRNMGLARSFEDGVHYALAHGADIVVNTDGDNEHPQAKIADLVQPIIRGEADIVIGDRQTKTVEHFTPTKKFLQQFGSKIVSLAAGVPIPDSVCGFRAYSKTALLRLNMISRYSYTTETIIQAGNKNLAIASVPIKPNRPVRASRLFKSNWQHVSKSAKAIIRSFIMYRPYVLFITLGVLLVLGGLVPFINYVVLAVHGHQSGHLHSLILGSVLLLAGFQSFVLSVVADLIRINRSLQETALEHIKTMRFTQKS